MPVNNAVVPDEDLPASIVPANDLPDEPQQSAATSYTITGSQSPKNPMYPVGNELADIGADTLAGIGKFWTDRALGVRQMLATGNPQKTAALQQEAAEKKTTDAPLAATPGGKLGPIAAIAPAMVIPGLNTWQGGALLGGGLGATDPTTAGDSRLFNTGTSAVLGGTSQKVGSTIGDWFTGRAAQPFMGWNKATANRAATAEVGSTAPKLTQSAYDAVKTRFSGIYNQARSPNAISYLGSDTTNAVNAAAAPLDDTVEAALRGNSAVRDLLSNVNGATDSANLGHITSRLGDSAATELSTRGGNRKLGLALYQVKDHVDDLIGQSITDPALASAYATTRQQDKALRLMTANTSTWNSSTGDVNMTAVGKLLQRKDNMGYARGKNEGDFYNAARWGQATGQGKGAPPWALSENLGFPQLKYYGLNNSATRALGGAVSRAGAPVAPYMGRGGQGLMFPLRQPVSSGVGGLLGFSTDTEQ